jgi:hypothetical protein
MGKFFDWLMCNGNYEEMQRIQLYKKLGNKLDSMSEEEIEEELEKLGED